jgi:adenosine kinase
MTEARFIELGPIVRRGVDLVVVAPNDPEAMRRHTEECRQLNVPFVADPSQQLARINAEEIRVLLDGARYLICNDYELGMIAKKAGWTVADVVAHVGTAVVTFGPKGSVLYRAGEPELPVPALPEQAIVDPTGVGDAFRAGFLCGHAWGASDERAAQLGSALATVALEVVGTQEYRVTLPALLVRIEDAYGAEVAFELEALAAASAAPQPDS